jgi:hypothetical protein
MPDKAQEQFYFCLFHWVYNNLFAEKLGLYCEANGWLLCIVMILMKAVGHMGIYRCDIAVALSCGFELIQQVRLLLRSSK